MNVKKKARRVMSGLLTAVTVLSTVLSPAVAYASDDAGSVKKIPYYEEIKDQLDEDEVVTAKDYEIKVGDNFDVKSDYTGLTIQDDSKVKVTFQEAKDTDGNDFSTDYAKCVWECLVPEKEVNRIEQVYTVSNRKYGEDGVVLRLISREKPFANAKQVDPVLEDLYLFYFREGE